VATAHSTTAPIRVARIITRLNVGGPAIQAVEMSARLEAAGYHTLLIHGRLAAGEGDMRYLVPPDPAFEVAAVRALRREVAPVADAAAVARVFGALCRFRPRIVHTHTAKAGTVGRIAALLYNATAGRRAPARLVHTYHGHSLEGYFASPAARTFAAIERALARRTDAIVAVSALLRDNLRRDHAIDAARFPVVPLGFDLSRFAAVDDGARATARRGLGIDRDAHVVAFVGRLTAIKQPRAFVDIAARLLAGDPRLQVLVAGGGDLEAEMRRAADAAGLGPRIRFLGWVRDLVPVYAASDLLAMTSRNEGTPVALIESLASGVTAVAFAVGGVPDVLTAADLGVLVAPDDVDAFVAAAAALLADPDRRAVMGARARASMLDRYGIDRLVRDLDALYRDLVG